MWSRYRLLFCNAVLVRLRVQSEFLSFHQLLALCELHVSCIISDSLLNLLHQKTVLRQFFCSDKSALSPFQLVMFDNDLNIISHMVDACHPIRGAGNSTPHTQTRLTISYFSRRLPSTYCESHLWQ